MDPATVADEDELEKCIRAYLPSLFFSGHGKPCGEKFQTTMAEWICPTCHLHHLSNMPSASFVQHAVCIISMYTYVNLHLVSRCTRIEHSKSQWCWVECLLPNYYFVVTHPDAL